MAIAFVAQRKAGTSLGVSSPATFSPATNTVAGNHLFLHVSVSGAFSVTAVSDSKGNTWQKDVENVAQGLCVSLWSCKVTTAILTTDTISVTWGGATAAVRLEEFSGLRTGTWLDKTASNSAAAGGSTIDCGTTAATTFANELVMGVWRTGSNETYTAAGSYTVFDNGVSTVQTGEYLVVSSTGTQNPTCTQSGTQKYTAVTATYVAEVAPFTAAVAGSAAVSASLVRARALTASVAGAAAVSASVVRTRAMSASIAGAAAVSASVVRTRARSASVAGAAAVSASLGRVRARSASITGAATVTVTLDVEHMVYGIAVALASTSFLEAYPVWSSIDGMGAAESPFGTDYTADNLVAGYSVRRGRTDEFQRTGTGTATITVNDTQGVFDPTNLTSPLAGELDGKQAAIALRNPVTNTWHTIFRGFIDDYAHTMDPSQKVTRLQIPLVDALNYFAGIELAAGVYGEVPTPAGISGDVYYPATSGTVDDRINELLNEVEWPGALRSIFTGNVRLQETIYSAGTSALTVIDDAADAEFPAIANRYIDKSGTFVFHGRLARFKPSDYGITTWKAGDGAAIIADSNTAQIRELAFSRPRGLVYNSAFFAPQGIAETDRVGQLVTDETSEETYGRHAFPPTENLIIAESVLTGNDANAECRAFGHYYVDNYKDPRTRVTRLVFRSLPPDDPRAAATWALICGVELSDVIQLTTSHPGGGGFDAEEFYVEGISYDVLPLNPDYADVTLALDVSPKAYYPPTYWDDGGPGV